jgi:heme-degrading monooxygenase HmoA
MVVRLWHGRVLSQKAAAYRKSLCEREKPDYNSVLGIVEVNILERSEGDVTHFVTLTKWQDMGAIRRFTGPDAEVAKYYAEDVDFLLEFEPQVVHYQVVG